MEMINRIVDMLFLGDSDCYCCGASNAERYICKSCRSSMREFNGEIQSAVKPLDRAFAAYENEGLLRELIHRYKFENRPYLSKIFITLLEEAMIKFQLTRNDVLTYVPLHSKREAERGYNQSKILADGISKAFGIEIVDALLKIKNTKPQSGLNRENRIKNAQDVFAINKVCESKIEGKRVLIIDDIWTTGSTMKECAYLLRRSGALSVSGLCLASSVI